MTASSRSLVALLLAAGCGVPDGAVDLALLLTPGPQSIYEPLALFVRPDPRTGELAVLHGDVELVRGTTGAGEQLRFDLDGRAYTLDFRHVQVDTDCATRNDRNKNPSARDVVCRDSTWLPARLASPEGPLPGSTPTLRGADPRRFLYTSLPGLLAGLLVGRVALTHVLLGLLLAIAAIAGGWMLGSRGFDGIFGLTHGLAFLVYAADGLFAALAWSENSRSASLILVLGAVLGAVSVVFAYPLWAEGGPLLAVAAGVLGIIVLALAVDGLTRMLGDKHPASLWLLQRGAAPDAQK